MMWLNKIGQRLARQEIAYHTYGLDTTWHTPLPLNIVKLQSFTHCELHECVFEQRTKVSLI